MEWSKAKSILIFLFAILNIFLLSSILWNESRSRPGADYIKHVENLLESRNIRIECKVPSYSADSGSVVYSDTSIDETSVVDYFLGHDAADAGTGEKVWRNDGKVLEIGNNIIVFKDSSPDTGLDIGDSRAVSAELMKVLKGLGMKQKDYVPDVWQEQDGRLHVRYVKKYMGQLLFDVYADFIVSSGGIECAAIVPGEVNHTLAESEILSAWHILALAKIRENSVITDICFGYKRINEGELYDSPVWRIRFSDGSELFYNAYTGEEAAIGNT
ncbi:MAG TPA: two-component system regulatory protein YycI [Thermoclostridium sp.]|nr:hypothetical protein [Clostridiaceae bacterium]HOQ76754.1 two-component system regulatory protein YycI [Thermoclostridium sp.]